MKKRKTGRVLPALLCGIMILLLPGGSFGCGRKAPSGAQGAGGGTSTVSPNANLPIPTLDEIWGAEVPAPDSTGPANVRLLVSPAGGSADPGGSVYVKWDTEWLELSGDTVRRLCRDPLCDHSLTGSGKTCPDALASGSNALFRYGDDLYFLGAGDGPQGTNLTRYSLTDAKAETVAKYETGGQMLGRLGNYIYYYIFRYDEPDETGRTKAWHQIYRFCVTEKKPVFLCEKPREDPLTFCTGAGDRFWWRDGLYHIVSANANLTYAETVVKERVLIYSLAGDWIYYLTLPPDGADSGDLRRKNLDSGEEQTLIGNVTWFVCDGEDLYYSLYEPAEGFAWDIKNEATGKVELHTVEVKHGNRIRKIALSRFDQKKTKPKGELFEALEALGESGIWLGEVFTVADGRLISHYRQGYEENGRHGMKSGIAAFDPETGEMLILMEETVFRS